MHFYYINPIFDLLGQTLGNYGVLVNINYLWNFGVIAGLMLAIQIITGILLNIQHIMRNVNSGWLLRYTHANGASMFFLAVGIHLFRIQPSKLNVYFNNFNGDAKSSSSTSTSSIDDSDDSDGDDNWLKKLLKKLKLDSPEKVGKFSLTAGFLIVLYIVLMVSLSNFDLSDTQITSQITSQIKSSSTDYVTTDHSVPIHPIDINSPNSYNPTWQDFLRWKRKKETVIWEILRETGNGNILDSPHFKRYGAVIPKHSGLFIPKIPIETRFYMNMEDLEIFAHYYQRPNYPGYPFDANKLQQYLKLYFKSVSTSQLYYNMLDPEFFEIVLDDEHKRPITRNIKMFQLFPDILGSEPPFNKVGTENIWAFRVNVDDGKFGIGYNNPNVVYVYLGPRPEDLEATFAPEIKELVDNSMLFQSGLETHPDYNYIISLKENLTAAVDFYLSQSTKEDVPSIYEKLVSKSLPLIDFYTSGSLDKAFQFQNYYYFFIQYTPDQIGNEFSFIHPGDIKDIETNKVDIIRLILSKKDNMMSFWDPLSEYKPGGKPPAPTEDNSFLSVNKSIKVLLNKFIIIGSCCITGAYLIHFYYLK